MSKRLFLSCASREFSHIREQLTADCRSTEVAVNSHEEVRDLNTGLTTLEKLDDYIGGCHAIVHLVGVAAGTQVETAGIEALLRRHPDLPGRLPQVTPLLAPDVPWRGSYTQWEAYLAIYHRIPCHVFLADAKFERPADFASTSDETQLQAEHLQRLARREQDRREFDSREELRVQVQRSLRKILPAGVVPLQADISRILRYAPDKLIGRDDELKLLNDIWLKVRRAETPRPHVLTFVALGGEGKTSLVAKWAVELAAQDWPGCDAAFAWSFYSQGTREQLAASSDLFLKEALTFFGDDADKAFAASPAGVFEKGQRLARIVGQRRSLLILDGLEPLQYAPTSPTPGQLKDQGIAALLKGLAATSHGLCVVTTRYSLPDLKAFWQTTAPEVKLLRLSREAGVHLLKTLGVRGTAQEFATLVEDMKGHALTLALLGSYLCDAHGGDIRKRDLVNFTEANEAELGGHTFHVLDAYVKWLEAGGAPVSDPARTRGSQHAGPEAGAPNAMGQRVLAILRLLGLFDRPATTDCLDALWKGDAIAGLTEPLIGLPEQRRMLASAHPFPAYVIAAPRAPGTGSKHWWHPEERETYGDMLGITGILTAYGNLFGTRRLPALLNAACVSRDVLDEPANFFCIGSPKVNPATERKMTQTGAGTDNRVILQGLAKLDDRLAAPVEMEGDSCVSDYGLIVRAPYPRDEQRLILIVAGRHSIGTHAACMMVTRQDLIAELEGRLKTVGVS